jgi:hypothetical protein
MDAEFLDHKLVPRGGDASAPLRSAMSEHGGGSQLAPLGMLAEFFSRHKSRKRVLPRS